MANIKTKWGLVIEGTLHAEKSIKWRNSLPSLSSRLQHKSQDVDMNAALFVDFFIVTFYRKLVLFIEIQLNNTHSSVSFDTPTGFS